MVIGFLWKYNDYRFNGSVMVATCMEEIVAVVEIVIVTMCWIQIRKLLMIK